MEPSGPLSMIWNITPEPMKKVCVELTTRWKDCERNFQVWTNEKFPPTYAHKVQNLFSALPVTALTLILPWQLSVTILSVGYIADIAYGPFDRQVYDNLNNGIGAGTALLTVSNAFGFLTTFNPMQLLATLVYGAISSTILPKGNLFA